MQPEGKKPYLKDSKLMVTVCKRILYSSSKGVISTGILHASNKTGLQDNPSETLSSRYETTIFKTNHLRSLGYEVVEKWEYVCSLYPWVCKYGKYPIGHPKIYIGEQCNDLNLKKTEGLIKCKILPPQDLYHPVLSLKMNNKLMFILCRTCGEQLYTGNCVHDNEQRALIGTWVLDEVRMALRKGYIMKEIFEIWEYNIELYSMERKSGGLFTSMINTFMKLKQEASDFPSYITDPAEREKYIEDYLEEKEPFNLLTDPAIIVNALTPVNEETLVCNYERRDEASESLATVNVCIAAYTTAQARLKLYSYLDRLTNRVLYYDTDSVIYISRDGEWDVPTGYFLSEMTDELDSY
ncbi:hypothetical protein JTB14_024111 [Gonioctena quinquepunctata]|nr:hypothetical protein JTB14_024111 [Gonioctena quinquepunctata]